jgi:acyl carrier protein
MIEELGSLEQLAALDRSERADALEALVLSRFRAALFLAEDEDLDIDGSFFDLGLTSLRLVELKAGLEDLIGRQIDANTLFNRPTVRHLLRHLTDDVLVELFAKEEV